MKMIFFYSDTSEAHNICVQNEKRQIKSDCIHSKALTFFFHVPSINNAVTVLHLFIELTVFLHSRLISNGLLKETKKRIANNTFCSPLSVKNQERLEYVSFFKN